MRKYWQNRMLVLSVGMLGGCQMEPAAWHPDDWHHRPVQESSTQLHNLSLTPAVYQALLQNKKLAPLPIQVESSEGIVYLSGYVKTIRQSDLASDIAKKVTGVKTVENNIIVRK